MSQNLVLACIILQIKEEGGTQRVHQFDELSIDLLVYLLKKTIAGLFLQEFVCAESRMPNPGLRTKIRSCSQT